jgi:hypothetical protein
MMPAPTKEEAMAKISRDDREDLEQILDRTGVRGLFEALAEIANEKESHVQEAWQDTALARRWAKLRAKFEKLTESVDDPY